MNENLEQIMSQKALNARLAVIFDIRQRSALKHSCRQECDRLISSLRQAIVLESATESVSESRTECIINALYLLAFFEV
jgi:hypothetical protein